MFVFLTSPGVPNDENIEMVQIDPNENSENVLNGTTVQIANADDTSEEGKTPIKHKIRKIKIPTGKGTKHIRLFRNVDRICLNKLAKLLKKTRKSGSFRKNALWIKTLQKNAL